MNRRDKEKELVKQIQAGDKEAFARLVDEYYILLTRFTWSILRNDEDALDAVQNVFRKIWQNRAKWKPKKLEPFLFRSMRNEALNLQGKRKFHSDVDELQERLKEVIHENPDWKLIKKLDRAIEEMPLKNRIPLILFYFFDFSYRRIAEIMGTTEKAVGGRLRRAIEFLRDRLHGLL